jgi:hypothetical protein
VRVIVGEAVVSSIMPIDGAPRSQRRTQPDIACGLTCGHRMSCYLADEIGRQHPRARNDTHVMITNPDLAAPGH